MLCYDARQAAANGFSSSSPAERGVTAPLVSN
jgi:hypothetical protein